MNTYQITPLTIDTWPSIKGKGISPILRKDPPYPKASLGFGYFIHQAKGNMSIVNNIDRRLYLVVNPYESRIRKGDVKAIDLTSHSSSYFKGDGKILSRAFYKLWEILKNESIISSKGSFRSAHIAEGPGAFIQATVRYRDRFSDNSKGDKYYAITLHSESNEVPKFAKSFIRGIERYHQYPTTKRDNGDVTNPDTIKRFKKMVGSPVSLVTADGGFVWSNENMQEQEATQLVLGQICAAIAVQDIGGSFVLKIFETFTEPMIKLLCVLGNLYDKVKIVKPYMSRQSNSEKYVVCLGYHGDKEIEEKLLSCLSSMYKKGLYLNDLFPSVVIGEDILKKITALNSLVADRQYIQINKIIKFVKGNNFEGATYRKYRDIQIEKTKLWIDRFMSS